MPFTASDLAAIDQAIATGAKAVEVEGRRLTYQDADGLLKLRAIVASEVNAASASPTPRMTRVVHVRA